MKKHKNLTFCLILGAITLFISCDGSTGPGNGGNGGNGGAWTLEEYRCADNPIADTLDGNRDDLGIPNAIVVKFNGNDPTTFTVPPAITEQVTVTVNGGHIAIMAPYARTIFNMVLSGETPNGSLTLYGIPIVNGFYLNGVNITNPRGPAINIQSSYGIPVYLVGGCGRENKLSDGPYLYNFVEGEDAKGTFFSEKRLAFYGNGYLEVRAVGDRLNGQAAHAIVVDNDLRIESGHITIRESLGDGLHANDDIRIYGGTIQIISTGDAIQNEVEGQTISINNAKVRLRTTGVKSHGIAGEDSTIIDGASDVRIHVTGNGAKGIRTRGFMGMRGGTLGITAEGTRDIDRIVIPPDTSNAAGIKVGNDIDNHPGEGNMEISGGTLSINARSAKYARGLNIDGSLTITGGNTNIVSDNDGIRTRANFSMSAGSLKARASDGQDIDCRGTYTHTGGTLDAPNRREGAN
ncbi:MAG: carbohydrate-binding domain-containing protein [Chitinispirillia bacterium]|nr:carbohydrate-binding domain-containing protein [Chitinispirillia bacterium]MCL2268052.1 carbohydrate-binding domain-containing protein [Chitinispirillia bacterium]